MEPELKRSSLMNKDIDFYDESHEQRTGELKRSARAVHHKIFEHMDADLASRCLDALIQRELGNWRKRTKTRRGDVMIRNEQKKSESSDALVSFCTKGVEVRERERRARELNDARQQIETHMITVTLVSRPAQGRAKRMRCTLSRILDTSREIDFERLLNECKENRIHQECFKTDRSGELGGWPVINSNSLLCAIHTFVAAGASQTDLICSEEGDEAPQLIEETDGESDE